MSSSDPLLSVRPSAVPPDNTTSLAPSSTTVLLALPPPSTTCDPANTVTPLTTP
jgi:hypothetical protein